MQFTGLELLYLFLIYSFLGWVLETTATAVKHRQFANRGLINGPMCVIYGITAVLITVTLSDLSGFWLFLGSMILASIIEWSVGHLIERVYHERWWDYSNRKWNLDGYICFSMSLLWGVFGYSVMLWGNMLLLRANWMLPVFLRSLIVWGAFAFLVLDATATMCILSGRSKRMESWKAADEWFTGISTRLGRWIYQKVDQRIQRAYPQAKHYPAEQKNKMVFAQGCGFYKLFLLFFIGAFLGDIIETFFCRATAGVWMSRSSVVWGPFSIVWGIGIAGITALLYRYRNYSDRFLFIMGTVLGGVYEYICSVFTEIAFGTVFWDYSDIPFNLGGRINLLFCFFWGIAVVVWFRMLYPRISDWLERIPVKIGKTVTWISVVFMICNITVSCMALARYDQRSRSVPAQTGWQITMDERFGDERMERIYPNALMVEE